MAKMDKFINTSWKSKEIKEQEERGIVDSLADLPILSEKHKKESAQNGQTKKIKTTKHSKKGPKGKNSKKALDELTGGFEIGSVKTNTPEITPVPENTTPTTDPAELEPIQNKAKTKEERVLENAELVRQIRKQKRLIAEDEITIRYPGKEVDQRKVTNTISGIKNALYYMSKNGIKSNSKVVGEVVYHDFFEIENKTTGKKIKNQIPWDYAYPVAKTYFDVDTFVSFNPQKGYIGVETDDEEKLLEIWEKIKKIIPNFPKPDNGKLLCGNDPKILEEVKEKITGDVWLEMLDMKTEDYITKTVTADPKITTPEPVIIAEPTVDAVNIVAEPTISRPNTDEGAEDEDSLSHVVKVENKLEVNNENEDPIKYLWARLEKNLNEDIDAKADMAQAKIDKRIDDFSKNLDEKLDVQEKKHELLAQKISTVNLNTQAINNIAQKIKDYGLDSLDAEERGIYEKVPHIINPMAEEKSQSLGSKVRNFWQNSLVGKMFNRKGQYVVIEDIDAKENKKNTLDTQAVADKINTRIAELEAGGKVLTPEEKTKIFREVSLLARADFNKKQTESSTSLEVKKGLSNFSKWWIEDLEKNRIGKAFKIGTSAAILGTATYLTGDYLNILPAGSNAATRILTRTGLATLISMTATLNLTKKIINSFSNKNKEEAQNTEEVQKGLRKYLTLKNIGLGTSFVVSGLLTGGVLAPVAMAGGVVLKNFANKKMDAKIKTLDEKVKDLEDKIKSQHFGEKVNINELVKNIDGWRTEREKVLSQIRNYTWGKSLINGAVSMGTGLTTLAIAHEHTETIKEVNKSASAGFITTQDTEKIKLEIPLETKTDNTHNTHVDFKTIDRPNFSPVDNTIHPNESDFRHAHNNSNLTNTPKPTLPSESIEKHFDLQRIEKGDGVTQVLSKLKNTPDWFKKELGDNPNPKVLAEFAKNIGAYRGNDNLDSLVIHTDDEIGFNKAGDLILKRDGHEFTLAHEGSAGKIEPGDWQEKMSNEKFMDTDRYPRNIDKTETVGVDGENFDLTPPEEITRIPDNIDMLETKSPKEINYTGGVNEKNSIDDYINSKTLRRMTYTEETWAKDPTNVYHISFADFKTVDALNKVNISHLLTENNLTERQAIEFKSILQHNTAETIFSLKMENIDEAYLPIWKYVHKLQEITNIKYLSGNLTHPAEKIDDYIYRALMKASKIGKLDQVKL